MINSKSTPKTTPANSGSPSQQVREPLDHEMFKTNMSPEAVNERIRIKFRFRIIPFVRDDLETWLASVGCRLITNMSDTTKVSIVRNFNGKDYTLTSHAKIALDGSLDYTVGVPTQQLSARMFELMQPADRTSNCDSHQTSIYLSEDEWKYDCSAYPKLFDLVRAIIEGAGGDVTGGRQGSGTHYGNTTKD